MDTPNVVSMWPAIGVMVTFGLSLAIGLIKVGQLLSRVDALEQWRDRVRTDMHEVSDQIGGLRRDIAEVKVLIEERTDRRLERRELT